MTNKLHTAKQTQEIFNSLGQVLGLQPYILSKLAIALSVKKGCIEPDDFKTDNEGLELSRQTIFGDHDLLFKALIINREHRGINEEEYTTKGDCFSSKGFGISVYAAKPNADSIPQNKALEFTTN